MRNRLVWWPHSRNLCGSLRSWTDVRVAETESREERLMAGLEKLGVGGQGAGQAEPLSS